jgi:CRISPR type III-B/RAMP module-associated protein Cmr5
LEVTGFKPYLDWKNRNSKEGSLLLEFLLVEADFQTLRLATMEVLAIANWLKRIVEVEIEE